jgi:hypothetical protein
MNEMNQVSNSQNAHFLQQVPNSTAALVLGIISIPTFCFCFGIVGVTLGIIGLVLGSKGVALYKQFPDVYTETSYKNANAGRICSIVGLSMSALHLIFLFACWAKYITWFSTLFGGLHAL